MECQGCPVAINLDIRFSLLSIRRLYKRASGETEATTE
jgi:hypothetical protein